MKDRVPGAPGQYKAEVTSEELKKMQLGEQFVITMTRDDQPIVEGTPYSKAAVLPDEVAEQICPGVEDPTPADAFAAVGKALAKKAPDGYIDSFHEYTNLSDVELDKMLLTIACNLESGKQHRCIISVNEDGLVLDRGYWFFEITRKGREVQIQGRLGSKTVYRTFADSRIANGLFEVQQEIPGWVSTNHAMTFICSERVKSGSYALKMIDNRTDSGGQLHSESVAVTAGAEYTAAVQVCGTASNNGAQLYLRFLDGDGKMLSQSYKSITPSEDAWSMVSVTAIAPVGAASAYVILATTKATNGTVYFDDAALTAPSGDNLLANPGFEKGCDIPGWNTKLPKIVALTGEYVGDSNGRAVLKVIDENASAGTQVWSDKVAATEGVTYKAGTIVCGGETAPSVQMCLRFFDSAAKLISQKVVSLKTQQGVWSEISAQMEAPEGAVQMDVLVTTTGATLGTAYFDNVTLIAEGDPEPGFSEWAVLDAATMPMIYSGSGVPDDSLGKDGDIYIQFDE